MDLPWYYQLDPTLAAEYSQRERGLGVFGIAEAIQGIVQGVVGNVVPIAAAFGAKGAQAMVEDENELRLETIRLQEQQIAASDWTSVAKTALPYAVGALGLLVLVKLVPQIWKRPS